MEDTETMTRTWNVTVSFTADELQQVMDATAAAVVADVRGQKVALNDALAKLYAAWDEVSR